MDLLKLLPLLFVAAQGDARAIHQQLLPAIPGYVPVYIQQEPDVQVIYETGRKAAVMEAEPAVLSAVQEVMPVKLAEEEDMPPKAAEVLPLVASPEEPKEVLPPAEVMSVLQPENPKGDTVDVQKADVDDKKDSEEQNSIRQQGSKRMVGSGSVFLVPGYQTDDK